MVTNPLTMGTSPVEEQEGAHLSLVDAPEVENVPSPLFLESLREFSRERWGLESEHLRLSEEGSELPAVETVLFLDRKGRITAPRLSPYIPVHFMSTPTSSIARLDRQWLDVGGLLAEEMRRRGLASVVALAPEVVDVRPWQWAGFNVELRYVFHVQLPLSLATVDAAARKRAAKAGRDGYRVERTTRMAEVVACLQSTQDRQQFHLDLSETDLEVGMQILGPDTLRAYVCYTPEGEPAAARVVLHHPGTRAIDWAAGINSAHLDSGANQLLISEMLHDLHEAGATAFDFSDATLAPVAAMKANWGGELVPVYAVDGGRVRALARHARDYWSLRRRRTSDASGKGRTS